ncbi:zinc ribbon domain-containing protein [bacterium]|nr:zinc ribbon domain-containing protein [bacterium]
MSRATDCPKCSASLPRRGRFCLECGLNLYEEGVRRRPVPWLPILAAIVAASLTAVYIVAQSRKPSLPPENEQVRALTSNLMKLLSEKEFREVVRLYCEPDKEQYDEVHRLLGNIVRGESGSHGLNIFRTRCMAANEENRFKEAERFAREFGAKNVEYVVAVLAALTFPKGDLRGELGGTLTGTDRTDAFLTWYLGVVFHKMDLTDAEVTEVGWEKGPQGDMLMVATMSYIEPVQLVPTLPDPTDIPWRRLGEGKWALTLTNQHLLAEVLAVLSRAKIS